MEAGGMQYSFTYKGIRNLMFDIKMTDPWLYKELKPVFNTIATKKYSAILIGSSGIVLGSAMVVSGFDLFRDNMGSSSVNDAMGISSKSSSRVVIGCGIMIASGVIAFVISPGIDDYYRFVNLFNRNNTDDRLEIKLQPGIIMGNAMGLKVSVRI
jgi:hypothetical protein